MTNGTGQRLPDRTSPYNVGGVVPRIRDSAGRTEFALKAPTRVFDGGGRRLGLAEGPVTLNAGAIREMDLDRDGRRATYHFAQRTGAGVAGFLMRSVLANPPPLRQDRRNPRPPDVSEDPLTVDAAEGRRKLQGRDPGPGLRYLNSHGEFAESGGNKAEHFGGRNPGELDYVYLLFAAPNVRYGGVARDSLPDGSTFLQGLDEGGRPIVEVVTMYHGRDLTQPEPVTFIYGRPPRSRRYGWIARANVEEL